MACAWATAVAAARGARVAAGARRRRLPRSARSVSRNARPGDDDGRGGAHLRARGPLARGRRDASPAGPRRCAGGDRRGGRGLRLPRHGRRGAARALCRARRNPDDEGSRRVRAAVVGARAGPRARLDARDTARALGDPGARGTLARECGRRPDGARPRARPRPRDRRRRTRRHDEHDRRRLRRQRLRRDHQPRSRFRRLRPGPRPSSEQHARRGRPRPRADAAGGTDAEHDGPHALLRRRRCARARRRRRRRNAPSHCADELGDGRARRSARSRRSGRTTALPSRRDHPERRARRRRGRARGARGAGVDSAPLGGAPPLLRRRQPRQPPRCSCGSPPKRVGPDGPFRRPTASSTSPRIRGNAPSRSPSGRARRLPSWSSRATKTPHFAETCGPLREVRQIQPGRTVARVWSTSRAICATSSSSLANARSSRRRCHSSTTRRRP